MRALIAGSIASSVLLAFAACGSDSNVASNAIPGVGGGGGGKTDSGSDAAASGGGINVSCPAGTKKCDGDVPQVCEATGWVTGTACPFVCQAGECTGECKPGAVKCSLDVQRNCDASGAWGAPTECEFGCEPTGCRSSCNAGEFNCYGNTVRQCDPGPPAQWVDVAPAVTCNAAQGQKCNAQTGTCDTLAPIGTTTPTGEYYQYGVFTTGQSAFLGGYDVTSHGDYIYVNRSSQNLDVYKVTILDSDNNGKLEPNQHPNNPSAQGPMEERVLEFVKTYTKAGDGAPMTSASQSEMFAMSNDHIFTLGPTRTGAITNYVFATQAVQFVAQPTSTTPLMSFLGYGAADKKWYSGNESNRRVYSYHEPTKAWVAEFAYPNLAGSHMDGIEVVVSPKTGEQFVYVTDMTSDFIGQYVKRDTGWEQEALFEYEDSTSSYIEGFGFGALNHFWATSGQHLYELGGGQIQEDLDPCPNNAQACGPELPACSGIGQTCKDGCCSGGPVR